jgi:peptidoglycan/LPS O-acetylase OafA/YrhL
VRVVEVDRVHRRLPYSPALDGLRGLAVAVVLLFHADVGFLPGGHLGVTTFFTLSGFLITGLLLQERHVAGRIALRSFWARRARRLVPAMLVCFLLVALVVHLADTPAPSGLLGDAVAAAGWAANWRFIVHGSTYADLFSLPSPFQHFWSLAVEEQFYVVFPLVVVGVLGIRAARPRTGRLALLLVVLIGFSTWQAARLYTDGAGLGHAYYGTDARMAELLVGALLAVLFVRSGQVVALTGTRARAVQSLGGLGLIGLLWSYGSIEKGSAVLYRGGFLAVALCTAAVIAAVLQEGSPLARLLGLRPIVVLGLISYGAYLYHWPLFLLLTASWTGLPDGGVLAVRLTATLALAGLSYRLLEKPVRRGALPTVPAFAAWGTGLTAGLIAIALTAGSFAPPAPEAVVAGTDQQDLDALPELSPLPSPAASPSAVTHNGTSVAAAVPRSRVIVRPPAEPRSAAPRVVVPKPVAPTSTAPRPAAPKPAAPKPAAPSPAAPKPKPKAPIPVQFTQDPSTVPVPPLPMYIPGRLRVVMVGDSVGNNLGWGLRVWAKTRKDVAVYNLAIPACPISLGGDRRLSGDYPFPIDSACNWWNDPASKRYQAFQAFDPDVVVVQDSVNEDFDRRFPSWGDWRGPADVNYQVWLIQQYQNAIDRWRAGGAKVLMTNSLCGDWLRYDHFRTLETPEVRVAALNSSVYPRLRGVTTADLAGRICPGGKFTDEVEGIADGRPDGFHFSQAASPLVAQNFLGPWVLYAGGRAPGLKLP